MRLSDRVLGVEEFMAVAEAGSFVAAAELLGLTPSGVGKGVQKLEARLGVRLFTRTTRRVALTEDGALFLEHCRRLASDLDDAETEIDLRRKAIAGLVRIGAPLAYGRLRIVPALSPFLKVHSELSLDLRLSDRLSDPIDERIDLIVRIGELDDSSMWARRIDVIRFGVFASPGYVSQHDPIVELEDIAAHQRLGFIRGTGKLLDFALAKEGTPVILGPTKQFLASDIEGVVAAAESGLGLAYLPTFLAAPSLERMTLVPVLEAFWIDGPPVHLIYAQPRQMPRRVRALAEHVIQAMKK
jgi:LysR family transcriptional regulator, regulator for bpeEF and oprC